MTDGPTLLVVHHTASPATQELLEAVLAGTSAEGLEQVTVVVRAALAATAVDVLATDGFVLGTCGQLSATCPPSGEGLHVDIKDLCTLGG